MLSILQASTGGNEPWSGGRLELGKCPHLRCVPVDGVPALVAFAVNAPAAAPNSRVIVCRGSRQLPGA